MVYFAEKTIHQVILVGLGKNSSTIVRNILDNLYRSDDVLKKTLSGITVNEGNFQSVFWESKKPEDSGVDDINNELKIDGINLEFNEGVVKKNHDIFSDRTNDISRFFVNHYNIFTGTGISGSIEEQELGIKIHKNVLIYIFLEASDPIASTVLLPFLEVLQKETSQGGRITTGESKNLSQPQIILFMPDLFSSIELTYEQNDNNYKRTFSLLNELEESSKDPVEFYLRSNKLKKSDNVYPESPFSQVLVLSSGDSPKLSFEELEAPCTKFIQSRITNDYSIQFAGTKYFSFGYSELVYPEKIIMEQLNNYMTFSTLELKDCIVISEQDVEKIRMSDVESFLLENKVNYRNIDEELTENIENTAIWSTKNFSPSEKPKGLNIENKYNKESIQAIKMDKSIRIVPDMFLNKMEIDGEQFKKKKVAEAIGMLNEKYKKHLNDLVETLKNNVNSLLDDEKKGINYAKTFIDQLLKKKENILKKEEEEKDFIDNIIEKADLKEAELRKKLETFNNSELKASIKISNNDITDAEDDCNKEFIKKDEFMKDWTIKKPIIYSSLFLLLFFTLTFGAKIISITKAIDIGVLKVLPVLLIIYAILFYKKHSEVKKNIVSKIDKFKSVAQSKIFNMNRFISSYDTIGEIEFDLHRVKKSKDFAEDFRSNIKKIEENLKEFNDNIVTLKQEKQKEYDNMDLSGTILIKNVVEKSHIENWIDEKDKNKEKSNAFFLKENNKFSSYFNRFIEDNKIKFKDEYMLNIRDFTHNVFKKIREQSIETFFADYEKILLNKQLDIILKYSTPFIKLSDLKAGDGIKTDTIKYLNVLNKDNSDSNEYLKGKREKFTDDRFNSNKNSISIHQIIINFTIDTIPAYIRGKQLINRAEEKDKYNCEYFG